jgi:AsmA family protein
MLWIRQAPGAAAPKEGAMSWKRILIAAAVVIAALIIAAWVIVATFDYNKIKPQIENAFKETTGRELTLKGSLKLKIGFSPTLEVNNAVMQNASWGSRPEMAEIKRFEVQLSLVPLIFRSINVKRIVLVSPDILIETSREGESNLSFIKRISAESTKKEASTAQRTKLTVNKVSIENGRITYRNGKTGASYVAVLKRFEASARSADSALRISLDGSYNDRPFKAEGKLVPLSAFTAAGKAEPISLTVELTGTSITVGGTIRDVAKLQGANMKVTVKSKDAARIGEFFGKSLPVRGPLELACRFTDPGPKVYQISDLKASVSGSDVEGSAGVDMSGPRPILTANLTSKRLDLRPMAEKKQTSPRKRNERDRVFPQSPLPLKALRSADARVNFTAGELLSPRLALHNLNAHLALEGGRLGVQPLAAVVSGGNIDGRFDLDARGTSAAMSAMITVNQLDVGGMLRELGKTNIVEGRVNLRIDVNGRGDTVARLMSGLNGTAYMIMGKGRINNKYIGFLGSNISSDIFRIANPLDKQSPITEVSCIVCGFKIRNGVADTTALVINGEYMAVVGDGTVDLRTEKLDVRLRPVPKEEVGTGLTGKLGVSLGELTRPFKLGGTLADPSVGIDVTQTAITAGKAVGGFMLLGPVGLGGALIGETSSEQQLCPLAVNAAQQGVKLSVIQKKQKKGDGTVGKTTEGVKKGMDELGKSLKGIFGK